MAAGRRAAFDAYYKKNPSKLGGKTLDEAYAAMKKEAARRGLKVESVGGTRRDAIDRRLAKARKLSQDNKKAQRPYTPVTVGEGASKVASGARGVYNRLNNNGKPTGINFPDLGKAWNNRPAAQRARRNAGLPETPVAKGSRSFGKNEEARKLAIKRRVEEQKRKANAAGRPS